MSGYKFDPKVIDWLLASAPYVEYATRINILNEEKGKLTDLRQAVIDDPRIKEYLADVADFNGKLITTHKNPDLTIHKLNFLLDVGLGIDVPEINQAIQQILDNRDELGMYKSPAKVAVQYGGTGEVTLGWALCDAPLMLYALFRTGVPYEEYIKPGVDYILGLERDNGFPCAVSKELGKWRGPGRKDDCCPYVNLIMAKLLAMIPEYANSEAARVCVDELFMLWENSRELHPYMFFMGKDFRKLKAPAIWYDIVHVADVLSCFDYAREDGRFKEMLDIIAAKATADHRFIPESIYQKCQPWDFGQKKQPSAWLTYLCVRILARSGWLKYMDSYGH